MATIRMVTEIKTLPMDEQERVIVPRNDRRRNGTIFAGDLFRDILSPSQVFTLIRQTAFGEVGDNTGYSQYMVGDVSVEMRFDYTFQGVQLSAGMYPPYYRRVMVKKDDTFSIRDLRSKVAELQALLDEIDAERKRQQAETLRKREEAEAARDELYYRTTALLKNLGDIPPSKYNAIYQGSYCMDTGVFASVFDLQKEEIALSINGLTVEQAKVVLATVRQINESRGEKDEPDKQ